MSDELDAGAAYLAALKRSSTPDGAATVPASVGAHTGEASPGNFGPPSAPQGRVEKRRSPRYRCRGSARLQEDGGAAATWATFTDISMHGCYMEAANPHRVGTVIGMRLEANGFRIEAAGTVRVAYPGVGMGISFNQMSDENREQLRELVRSVARPSVILGSCTTPHPKAVPQQLDLWRAVANPAAALQAMFTFFEDRHMMGREEFLRIVRNSQGAST